MGDIAAALAAGEDPSGSDDTGEGADDTPAWQQRLATEFSAALRSSEATDDMCMSLYRNGKPIFEHKANTPLLPASLAKLATVSAALSELGADATFTTRVVADADALDAVSDGVLRGDLYLIGGGDPVLATPGYINRIANARPYTDVTQLADSVMAALEAHGIDTIEGAIVGDGSWFADGEQSYTSHSLPGADPETPAIWKQSYLSQNFVGVLSGLIINDGLLALRHRPPEPHPQRRFDPSSSVGLRRPARSTRHCGDPSTAAFGQRPRSRRFDRSGQHRVAIGR